MEHKELVKFLNQLKESDIKFLDKTISIRNKKHISFKQASFISRFNEGDRVKFVDSFKQKHIGIVDKVNQKYVRVMDEDSHKKINVPPKALRFAETLNS